MNSDKKHTHRWIEPVVIITLIVGVVLYMLSGIPVCSSEEQEITVITDSTF